MATVQLPSEGDFPGNAHSQKQAKQPERPEVKKIVTGNVSERKKSIWARIGESFTGDDMKSVITFVMMDVVVPSTKSLISDTLTTAVERFFFGDARPRNIVSRPGAAYGQYTMYNRVSTSSAPPWDTRATRPSVSPRARATHDFREVLIDNRHDAALVLDTLTEMVSKYDVATVADFYDCVGFTSEFTDRNWGWNDLRDASVVRVNGGYLIQLPPPIQIK